MSESFIRQHRRESIVRLSLFGACVLVALIWFIVAIFDAPEMRDNYTNSYSPSPGGHRALMELLAREGYSVKRETGVLKAPAVLENRGDTRLLLEPRRQFIESHRMEFETMVREARWPNRSVLIALPKRVYDRAYELEEPGEVVLREAILSPGAVSSVYEKTGFEADFDLVEDERDSVTIQAGEHTATLHGPVFVLRSRAESSRTGYETLVATDRGDAVVVRYRGETRWQTWGGYILVTDPDMFSNRYLDQPGIAATALHVLSGLPDGTLIFDERMHGYAADASFEYVAATPPGLWITLSVILVMILFGWRQATVLRPVSANEPMRDDRRFAIEGVARMMERAGAHEIAAGRVLKRGRLIREGKRIFVREAAVAETAGAVEKGKVEERERIYGADDVEKLVNAARYVARRQRQKPGE